MNKILFFFTLLLIVSGCRSSDSDNLKEIPTKPLTDLKFKLSYKTPIDNLEIKQMIKTKDNHYVAIVSAEDYHVIKFDSNFNIVWNKVYGGSKRDYAEGIIEDSQGNLLVIGESESTNGDIEKNNGDFDIFLIKINGSGDLIWSKNYGGSGYEGVSQDNTIVEAANGNFIFVGYTSSSDINVSNNNGGYDVWISKIDSNGNLIKQKTFGGSNDDFGRKIIKLNNNFIITLKSNSSNNDFAQIGNWIASIDAELNIIWKKSTQGINSGSITVNNNEIFLVNSTSTSYELSKLDSNGNVTKSSSINFSNQTQKQPFANQIISSNDGGLFIIGDFGYGNEQDAVIFKVNKNFEKVAENFIAGNNFDKSRSIFPIQANKFLYIINSASTNLQIPLSGKMSSIITEITEE
ncbi:membrane lipoprotein lipid attachment site-containing protein [Elizabethkingia bruuniana]|uniref:membrane lipoprotein lipid attachment site-containing protein n=1 Tax=Elizabethkingia bruuniana TaxID=1756149 RepID=UPI00241EA559|nr:membrane lipoprotein lipid attachment site-containing protein [Elizabethkingia bruuniana]